MVLPLYAMGDDFEYKKGTNIFIIKETKDEYRVTCIPVGNVLQSRNKNIINRQNRMTAIDLIGAYIVFTSSEHYKSLKTEYFPYVVDGIDLHYNAVVEGIQQKEILVNGKTAQEYICRKEDYRIDYASYKKTMDLNTLVAEGYKRNKCEETAMLLYELEGFTSEQYLAMEKDFLTGNTQLSLFIRRLQAIPDRFELSVYIDSPVINLDMKTMKRESPSQKPYSQFYYEELVTAAPAKDKDEYYSLWKQTLSEDTGTVYENMLLFCSNECVSDKINYAETTLSETIEAYPGAVSPFDIRSPINDSSYNMAATAYSESDFEKAAELLQYTIDNEGISPDILNLLGASYRYMGKPEKALPYLLLCLKLNPYTKFLAGNIAICMSDMGFGQIYTLCNFLLKYAQDEWSKTEINKILNAGKT